MTNFQIRSLHAAAKQASERHQAIFRGLAEMDRLRAQIDHYNVKLEGLHAQAGQ